MNKFLFWIFTIILGFVSPLISFGLIFLHYLPEVLQDFSQSNSNKFDNNQDSKFDYGKSQSSQMNSFSKDTLEESR
jgi:anionic cell wall polymer biosynthesis LytR-Cps2A-Psr (LCP) family protein